MQEISKENFEESLEKLQKPVQLQVMALLATLESQKSSFPQDILWVLYVKCMQEVLNKDFAKLIKGEALETEEEGKKND